MRQVIVVSLCCWLLLGDSSTNGFTATYSSFKPLLVLFDHDSYDCSSRLYAENKNKNKIAGPRAVSRPPPSSRQQQQQQSSEAKNPWNVIKDSFYNARDVMDGIASTSSSLTNKIGAGYQDDRTSTTTTPTPTPYNNNKEDINKKKNNNNSNPFFNNRARNTNTNPSSSSSSSSSGIRQISMEQDMGEENEKTTTSLTHQLQEIPQAIQTNIENTQRTAQDLKDKYQELEESLHNLKVFLKLEKETPKPTPPPPVQKKDPKKKQLLINNGSSDVAKFSLQAGSGLTAAGLFKSIGSSTAWAINKAMENQNKQQTDYNHKKNNSIQTLNDISNNMDWTKKIDKIDTESKTTEELLAELDPELSAEVAEALRLAQEALDAMPPSKPKEEKQPAPEPEPVVIASSTMKVEKTSTETTEPILSKQEEEVKEEIKLVMEEVQDEKPTYTAPESISEFDTAELEEEIETFLSNEKEAATKIPSSSSSSSTREVASKKSSEDIEMSTKDIEMMQEVEDALKRARQAAEEARRDVEELQQMLKEMI